MPLCHRRANMFSYVYFLNCHVGEGPRILQMARAHQEPRRGQSLSISCMLFRTSVPGPTSVRARPWHVGAPGLSRPPSPTLKKAGKRKGSLKQFKEGSKTIKSYAWYSGLCLGATVAQVCTAKWFFKNMLPPNRFKWEGLGRVVLTIYYLIVVWGESSGSSKGPGRLESPDAASVDRLIVLWFLPRCQGPPRGARAHGMWSSLAYPVAPTIKEASKSPRKFQKR